MVERAGGPATATLKPPIPIACSINGGILAVDILVYYTYRI
jgi:hypothetical protein